LTELWIRYEFSGSTPNHLFRQYRKQDFPSYSDWGEHQKQNEKLMILTCYLVYSAEPFPSRNITVIVLEMMPLNHPTSKDAWPHAPPHRLSESGIYMVTVGTYGKQHLLTTSAKLQSIQDGLIKYAVQYGWIIEAWAVFSNHYHFVGRSSIPKEGDSVNLSQFLGHFHTKSATWLNKQDQVSGRKVWHNFWETRLTHQKSYLARLNYVHQNPVKHGLTTVANQYPFCSARKFESSAPASRIKSIYSIKTDRLKVIDDYEPVWLPE